MVICALREIPSSSSLLTTEQKLVHGRMAAPRRSEVRTIRTGRVPEQRVTRPSVNGVHIFADSKYHLRDEHVDSN